MISRPRWIYLRRTWTTGVNFATMMLDTPVLILNQNYQPLNVCNVRRAMVLMGVGKAEMLTNGRGDIHTVSDSFGIPSVIRLMYMVKRPVTQRKLSRRAVFYRDNFTCQYCGKEERGLTIDHIVPRSQRGPHTWANVVSACVPCNHRKAGRTPKQANLRLLREPLIPRPDPYSLFHHRTIIAEWREWMPWAHS